VLPLALALNVDISAPVTDGFHEGEYLANVAVMDHYYSTGQDFPVLIHGAMDYLPSLMSRQLADVNHIIVWTRLINILFIAIAWIIWLDIATVALRTHPYRYAWHALYLVTFLWIFGVGDLDPLHKQQSFLSIRENFLLLSVWAGVRASVADSKKWAEVLVFATGVFAGLALYWSYDRGVLAAIWILSLVVSLVFLRRRRDGMTLLFGYVVSLVCISRTRLFGTLSQNCENIYYWIKQTRDVWFIPLKLKLQGIPGAIAMAAFAAGVVTYAIHTVMKSNKTAITPALVGLVSVQVLLLPKLYSQPGFPSNYYFIWPSLLLVILAPPKCDAAERLHSSLARLIEPELAGRLTLTCEEKMSYAMAALFVVTLASNGIVMNTFMVRNSIRQVRRPASDASLLGDRRYLSGAASSKQGACVFLWSNEGTFALSLQMPFCTRFPYAVYIAKAEEGAVLGELKRMPPAVVVYGSPHPWSMKISGRSMQDRLPQIDQFIRENYEFHAEPSGYIFGTPRVPSLPKS